MYRWQSNQQNVNPSTFEYTSISYQNVNPSTFEYTSISYPSPQQTETGMLEFRSNNIIVSYFSEPSTTGLSWDDAYILQNQVFNVGIEEYGLFITSTSLYLKIQNCTIIALSSTINKAGIRIDNCSNIAIRNCTIMGFYNGLFISNSQNIHIEYNLIQNNTLNGIEFENVNSSIIQNSTISSSSSSAGINLEISNNNTISGNTISSNKNGVIFMNSNQNEIISNDITGNQGSGLVFQGSSQSNQISGNLISNNLGNGILLTEITSLNQITGNSITSNTLSGISLLDYTLSNNIQSNTISSNLGDGITIGDYSSQNSLSDNTISSNVGTGVDLGTNSGSSNEVWDNVFSDNSDSDIVDSSTGGNSIYDNTQSGGSSGDSGNSGWWSPSGNDNGNGDNNSGGANTPSPLSEGMITFLKIFGIVMGVAIIGVVGIKYRKNIASVYLNWYDRIESVKSKKQFDQFLTDFNVMFYKCQNIEELKEVHSVIQKMIKKVKEPSFSACEEIVLNYYKMCMQNLNLWNRFQEIIEDCENDIQKLKEKHDLALNTMMDINKGNNYPDAFQWVIDLYQNYLRNG